MVQLIGSTVLSEEVYIVGNSIGSISTNYPGMHISNTVAFHVENNFFADNASGFSAIRLVFNSNFTQPASTVINNSFSKATPAPLFAVANVNGYYFNLVVKNNAYSGFSSGMVTNTPFWSNLIATHNIQGDYFWMNDSTGEPTQGSSFINGGDPDPRYLDLDLTTNDAGCYGGSNSRANFITPMGSAVVGFMRAPRVVSQGDAVNISATGFDR